MIFLMFLYDLYFQWINIIIIKSGLKTGSIACIVSGNNSNCIIFALWDSIKKFTQIKILVSDLNIGDYINKIHSGEHKERHM